MSVAPKSVVLGLEPTFGFGDRLGVATPGHMDALRAEGGSIRGIFAQQSIREMTRTQRTPAQVMEAASSALADEQFADPWGSDADHLKTTQDVDLTVEAGFVFFTIDPSDYVDEHADDYDAAQLQAKFDAVRDQVGWIDTYLNRSVPIHDGLVLTFDEPTVQQAAVKYGKAIAHVQDMAQYIAETAASRGQDHEIEISVDETPQPTTLAEHYIIADQLLGADVNLVSLAPRYIGDFEKGVDFKGDLALFERSLADHAAIAAQLGSYKLSLHSGSDKLAIYESFARITRSRFHVKTAGTSYLEAVRVAARHDEALLRRIIDFGRAHYDTDRATYHVSATVDAVPAPVDVPDAAELERIYLECWEDVPDGKGFTNPGRQILHCTFGSVLTDAELGPALKDVLNAHPETYRQVLADHFGRHLVALRRGM